MIVADQRLIFPTIAPRHATAALRHRAFVIEIASAMSRQSLRRDRLLRHRPNGNRPSQKTMIVFRKVIFEQQIDMGRLGRARRHFVLEEGKAGHR